MELLIVFVSVIWIIGWISEVAQIDAIAQKNNIDMPPGAKPMIVLLMLFTWPYWYFYNKAH